MKSIYLLILSATLFSCSKNDDVINDPGNIVPSAPDTLTSGWSKVGSLPVTETASDIFFTDANNGYATTEEGIYKTTDGGNTWGKIFTAYGFVNIAANGTNAVFLNQTKFTFNTLDRGVQIQKTPYDNPGGIGFQDVFYSSSNIAYLTSLQYIWKSTNGGVSFDTLHNFRNGDGGSFIYFINDLEGYVYRAQKLYKTINGGLEWTVSATLTNRSGPVYFLNTVNGFHADNQILYKTTNSGLNWQLLYTFPGTAKISDIRFFNELSGYCLVGTKIYKTSDGGNTWLPVVALGGKNLNEFHFLDEQHGWASGDFGYILRFSL